MNPMIRLNLIKHLLVVVLLCRFVMGQSPQPATLYNPAGKRDPFKAAISNTNTRNLSSIYPTERYDLEQLSLKAILRFSGKSRALVEAPDKQTFILFEGDIVGRQRATLSRILKSEIIFTQKTANYLGNASLVETVVSLPGEESIETPQAGSPKRDKANAVNKEKNGNSVSEAVKTISNRPQQLEQQIDDLIKGKK